MSDRSSWLSKSRYKRGVQCPKMLWMDLHMPGELDESVTGGAASEAGDAVREVARGYYGDFVEVPPDPADPEGAAARTLELVRSGCPTVCAATFAHEGGLCTVDMLRAEGDGVRIVGVKSTTHLKDAHYHDLAYQAWLVGECGLEVRGASLMHLNRHYVRHGDVDPRELFVVRDCTDRVMGMLAGVPASMEAMRRVASQPVEPDQDIGQQCKSPQACGYRPWCWRHLPRPSVFDLFRMQVPRALKLRDAGITSPAAAYEAGVLSSPRQLAQAECEARGLREVVDREALRGFLGGLGYPLYFLDFETWQPAIPPFDGTRPYQQIPTQYSLHVLERPGGRLEHREFLARAGADPRRPLAERLVADIPEGARTLAYSMSFERDRILELAVAFPDLSSHLMSIREGMADLLVPFQRGWYYDRAMGGSNSIKVVLPALFPGDPELDYHALDGVHNGTEAMNAFAALADMGPEEEARTREQLLRYCELDTYAMVRIWQRLAEAAGR